jgi:hypothetical protein
MQFDAATGRRSASAGDELLYFAAVISLVRVSRPSLLAQPEQDNALQTPQAEWTNAIVERETVLIFGHRHRLAAGWENIPYEILLR